MGAWGPGIFENDDACDILNRVDKLVNEGKTPLEATEICMEVYKPFLQDPSFMFAIADIQMKHRCLQPEVKEQCLRLIWNKQDWGTWADLEKRKQVVKDFYEKLMRY